MPVSSNFIRDLSCVNGVESTPLLMIRTVNGFEKKCLPLHFSDNAMKWKLKTNAVAKVEMLIWFWDNTKFNVYCRHHLYLFFKYKQRYRPKYEAEVNDHYKRSFICSYIAKLNLKLIFVRDTLRSKTWNLVLRSEYFNSELYSEPQLLVVRTNFCFIRNFKRFFFFFF